MERLTFIDHLGWYVNGNGGERIRGSHINRLAAYEDTGLEPEQVMELKSFTQGGIHKVDDGWKHVQDLLQAENEGRLVVLPYIDQSLAEKYTLSIRRNDKTRTMVVRVEEKGESACTKN